MSYPTVKLNWEKKPVDNCHEKFRRRLLLDGLHFTKSHIDIGGAFMSRVAHRYLVRVISTTAEYIVKQLLKISSPLPNAKILRIGKDDTCLAFPLPSPFRPLS